MDELLTPQLEGDYAPLYDEYAEALGAAFAEVEPWWVRMRETHGGRALRARWPAGPASHPRVLGVYRSFHARCEALAELSRLGPPPRFDDDAAWGSEAELSPSLLVAPDPPRLLIERLQVEHPDLYAKMSYLLLLPIAQSPEPAPSVELLGTFEPEPRPPQLFEFEGPHMAKLGVRRLLGAGIDLRPRSYETLGPGDASVLHRQAFGAYERALEQAFEQAERWWEEQVIEQQRRGLEREQARSQVWARHRLGPVEHPRVLGVVCAYWALCHEINAMLSDAKQHLAPELMLLAWLRDGRHDSWLDLLCAMPYWPVALDAAGRWS